jgi:hypothetical protein
MGLILSVLVIAGATALMVGAMLGVRRGAPAGSRFQDGDRASGVFGVLATGFALLLGFVIFLAFTKYDDSRSGAETEALVLAQQFETAQLMPPGVRSELSGELTCYGRFVVHQEWPTMQSGEAADAINPWAVSLFRTLQTVEPGKASEQSAYDAWLAQTSTREEGRRDRMHAAEGIVPLPVWLVLFFSGALILLYMLFFADSGESKVVQAMMAGSVTAVMVATLLVLAALNSPFTDDVGGIRPVAMQRTLAVMDEARAALGVDQPPPCDEQGNQS